HQHIVAALLGSGIARLVSLKAHRPPIATSSVSRSCIPDDPEHGILWRRFATTALTGDGRSKYEPQGEARAQPPQKCRDETTATGVGILMKIFRILGCAAIVICSAMAAPAFPQQQRPQSSTVRPAPAPLIGVGVPMIGGLLAALLLAHRLRRKE